MSDSDLLRRAANKARETAQALGDNRGPWYVLNRDQNPYPQSIGNIGVPYCVANTHTSPEHPPVIADHIALWHPRVAFAVAGMLACATEMEPDERETVAREECGWCGYNHLAAVARALLNHPEETP